MGTLLKGRPLAAWAALVAVGATVFAVSIDGARSPLQGVGLLIAKPPALAIGSALCAIACALAWRRRKLPTTRFDIAALGYLMACAASAAWSRPSLPFLLPWLAMHLAAFVVMAAAGEGAKQNRDLLIDGLVVVAAIVAAVAVYEAAGGALPWNVGRRPGATFGNRNAVGGFCAIVLPLAVARVLLRPACWRTLSSSLLILAVLLCRARSSWMGLLIAGAAAAAIWLLAWRKRRASMATILPRGHRSLLVAVVLAGAALNVAPWSGLRWTESSPILSSFSRMLEYETGTGRSRVDQHRVGLAMLEERPILGFGPGSWRREAPRFVHAATDQHTKLVEPLWTPASDLLRQAVETGLLGIAAAAAMVVTLLAGARARIADPRDLLPLALLGSMLVAVVISAFDALLYRPPSVALVAIIAGALRNECAYGTRQVPAWIATLAAALSAAACLAMTIPAYLAANTLSRSLSAETVVALGESRFQPHEALKAVYASRGKSDCAALMPAATLVDTHLPNEPENLWVLARCAQQQGRWSEVEALLERIVRLEPHDAAAAKELGEARSRR